MINTATSAVILKRLGFRSLRGGALPLLSLPRTLWFLLLIQPSDSRFGVFVLNAVKDGDAYLPGALSS